MMHLYEVKAVENVENKKVLILVVMDDALVHTANVLGVECKRGLNPCCNG